MRIGSAALATLAANGCESTPPIVRQSPSAASSEAGRPATAPLWFEQPPAGVDAARWIRSETATARANGERAVVYVGATWCEPCRNFHAAVEAHALDARLPRTRFLQFDADQHAGQLAAIGYASKYVPLFALPGEDGQGVGKQIQGSIKGPGAADEIAPRLLALLAGRGE
jgi:thiol-disulfide isomerase/thioredoxin